MPVSKIADLLAAPGELRALSRHARYLAELQQVLSGSIPSTLSKATRVKNYRSGVLILLADNPAVAAKLRQLAPRLLLHVQKTESEVTGIHIDVQVKSPGFPTENEVTKRALPTDAITEFGNLANTLPASPLKSALVRLVARRRARNLR
jgi:hypothetical protein